MDRQHPRDIFDVMHVLDHFGWRASFVECFVAYFAGHNRPVHEVLFPEIKTLEPASKLKKSNAKRFAAQHDMLAERFEEDAT